MGKFSVEVETDSSLYDVPLKLPQKSRGLTWNIQVVVDQVRLPADVEKQVEKKIEQVVKKADRASVVSTTKPPPAPKKESFTETSSASSRTDVRKQSRVINPRGRCHGRETGWCSQRRWESSPL